MSLNIPQKRLYSTGSAIQYRVIQQTRLQLVLANRFFPIGYGLVLFSWCSLLQAETLNIAVASNFAGAAEAIKTAFEKSSEHEIQIIRGSSGKHYAQIRNGAPFDVFLSADQRRPKRLVDEGWGITDSRKTYAHGQLALWSSNDQLILGENYLLNTEGYTRIAIANPRLAPYGQAAIELFTALKLNGSLSGKLVMGENVAQTFQFVFSRNVDAGLVAYSQLLSSVVSGLGAHWLVPGSYYHAIKQDMVLLTESSASREFAAFMSSDSVNTILQDSGYLLPGVTP